jgi:hypothetical protein
MEELGKLFEHFIWQKNLLTSMSRHYTDIDPKYAEHWRTKTPGSLFHQ